MAINKRCTENGNDKQRVVNVLGFLDGAHNVIKAASALHGGILEHNAAVKLWESGSCRKLVKETVLLVVDAPDGSPDNLHLGLMNSPGFADEHAPAVPHHVQLQ